MLAELSIGDPKDGKAMSQKILCNLAAGQVGTGTMVALPRPSYPTATEEVEEELQEAWDDVSGRELDASKVRKARAEEVAYIHKTKLYTKVPRSKATNLGPKSSQ